MNLKKAMLVFLMMVVLMTMAGCVPGDGTYSAQNPAGFFWGVWHGWVAPISLIIGLFNGNIRIYEVNNTGWYYDLGFYIAVISGFGGISLSRKRSRKKNEQ